MDTIYHNSTMEMEKDIRDEGLEKIHGHIQSGGTVKYGNFKVVEVNLFTGLIQLRYNDRLCFWACPEKMEFDFE